MDASAIVEADWSVARASVIVASGVETAAYGVETASRDAKEIATYDVTEIVENATATA